MGAGLRRVVLVGGPGSGKSLLLQRIAHRESKTGKTPLLAKLKLIAAKMAKERLSFDESLCSVALASSGFADEIKQTIVQASDILLFDGLDECGVQRSTIASELVRWAASHPEKTIIVTTRPIGHAPACLPNWPHYQLYTHDTYTQHLYKFAIDGVCREIFKGEDKQIATIALRLQKVLNSDELLSDDSRDYKIVRNVPLLFCFVLSLAVHGYEIPNNKPDLYRNIIKLLAKDDVQDRGAETNIEPRDASLFLNALAWFLMETPVREYESLIQSTGNFLAKELELKTIDSRRLAERAFKFWEERRLLEKLNHGTEDLVAFMHLGFCEYAAANHLESFSPENRKAWIESTRNDPRWKEVYLNAASLGLGNLIATELLEFDSPLPPDTDEAIFAAEILASSPAIDETVLSSLLQHLLPRLTSGYPSRICRAAELLLPLARLSPKVVGPAITPLLHHDDEWSRYAALGLCLEAGKDYVNVQELRSRYPDLTPKQPYPSSPLGGYDLAVGSQGSHKLKLAVFIGATKLLLEDGLDADLLERIERLYDMNLSVYQVSKLSSLLEKSEVSELIKISKDREGRFWGKFSFDKMFNVTDKSEQINFLDLMYSASSCGIATLQSSEVRSYIYLGAIAQLLRFGEMPAGNFWEYLLAKGHEEQAKLAIRGAMTALDINPTNFALDIASAKLIISENKEKSFFSVLPEFPVEADWSKCGSICSNEPKLLAETIFHPSDAFAFAAAEIIAAGQINDPLREALTEKLRTLKFRGLYIPSIIAEHIWGNETLNIFLNKLEQKLTSGCAYLLKRLPALSNGKADTRILGIIKRALVAESDDVAQEAATLCVELVPKHELHAELKEALSHWKKHEKPYPVAGGVIPESPRATIVQALLQRDGLSDDEIIILYTDVRTDVRDVARQALVHAATRDKGVVSKILDKIERNEFKFRDIAILKDISTTLISHEKERMLAYLNADDIELQTVMISIIKQLDLIAETELIELLSPKLTSDIIEIREAARRAMEFRGHHT